MGGSPGIEKGSIRLALEVGAVCVHRGWETLPFTAVRDTSRLRGMLRKAPHTFFFMAMSGRIDVLTLFRLLITSVLRDMGLGRQWSLRNKPQALHSTAPISSRRHSGVVDVAQFWHTGCVVSRLLVAIVAILICDADLQREIGADEQSKKRLI